MIELDKESRYVILSVRAYPGSRRNEIRGEQSGALKVAVTAAPEKGKANKAILQFLAKTLGLRKSQLEIVSGESSSHKRLAVLDITPDSLRSRIDQAMDS